MKEARGWLVRVNRGDKELVYRYATEAQARYFSAVFALGPSTLPRRHLSRKPKVEKASDEIAAIARDAEAMLDSALAEAPQPQARRRKRREMFALEVEAELASGSSGPSGPFERLASALPEGQRGRNVLEVDEPLPELADQIRRTL